MWGVRGMQIVQKTSKPDAAYASIAICLRLKSSITKVMIRRGESRRECFSVEPEGENLMRTVARRL